MQLEQGWRTKMCLQREQRTIFLEQEWRGICYSLKKGGKAWSAQKLKSAPRNSLYMSLWHKPSHNESSPIISGEAL